MLKERKVLKNGMTALLCMLIVITSGTISGCSKSSDRSSSGEIVNENEDLDEFKKADIDIDVGDVDIVKGDKYAIEAEYDKDKEELSYDVQNNKLTVKGKSKNGGFTIGFCDFSNNNIMKVKIYVPDDCKMDELKMKLNTGDGQLKEINSSKIDIDNDTGNIKCSNISSQEFKLKIDTGDVKADSLTTDKAAVKSSCGSVELKSLKTKGLDVENDTGDIDIQGELKGENIIECDTGSIDIKSSLDKKDYSYDIDKDNGKFELDGEKIKGEYKENNDGASNSFKIKSSTDKLNIEF